MIVDPPPDTPAPLATALNLTCNATGTPPPTYSWYRDGRLIPGAVLPYLYIAEATPENRGYYRCEVMNNIDSTQSTPGLVTIPGTLSTMLASFPDSSAPEREIEFIHAERTWYFFSRENPQR